MQIKTYLGNEPFIANELEISRKKREKLGYGFSLFYVKGKRADFPSRLRKQIFQKIYIYKKVFVLENLENGKYKWVLLVSLNPGFLGTLKAKIYLTSNE